MIGGITVEKMVRSRSSTSHVILNLLKCVQRHAGKMIFVFEGKDIKYYAPRIQVICGFQEAIIDAGGKKNVLEILEYIRLNPDMQDLRYACFVDRDFDVHDEPEEALYVTPTYSIENLYADPKCLAAIIQSHFDFTSYHSNKALAKLISRYESWLKKFLISVRELNAWLYVQKQKPGYKLKLNSVKFSDLISFSWDKGKLIIKKNYSLSRLQALFPHAATVTREEIRRVERTDFQGDILPKVRGKYLVEFLYEIVHKLIHDARSKVPLFFDKTRSVTLNVSKVNFLSDVGGHAVTPPCLTAFLQRRVS